MYNIEIYIDTCEDQTASAPKNGKDERSLRILMDGNRRRLKHTIREWFSTYEERSLRYQEYYNGR